jgi:hypothetical protein
MKEFRDRAFEELDREIAQSKRWESQPKRRRAARRRRRRSVAERVELVAAEMRARNLNTGSGCKAITKAIEMRLRKKVLQLVND